MVQCRLSNLRKCHVALSKGQGPRMNQGAQLSHLHYMYMGLFSHVSLLECTDVFFLSFDVCVDHL